MTNGTWYCAELLAEDRWHAAACFVYSPARSPWWYSYVVLPQIRSAAWKAALEGYYNEEGYYNATMIEGMSGRIK